MDPINPEVVQAAKAAGQVVSGLAIWKAIGGKEAVLQTFGPSLDALGLELRGFTERALTNLKRVIQAAREKAVEPNQGEVPPRVINAIINEGIFCEDQLAAEYLGGVLASSRVSDLRDDRAASWVNVLSRLNSYQIRGHYQIYASARSSLISDLNRPQAMVDFKGIKSRGTALAVLKSSFIECLDLKQENGDDILTEIVDGLRREELIDEQIPTREPDREILFRLTQHGVSLFVWSHGRGKQGFGGFLDRTILLPANAPIPQGRVEKAPAKNAARWS